MGPRACVPIVEMTGSQVKLEALGTNSFKMAELEADDQ